MPICKYQLYFLGIREVYFPLTRYLFLSNCICYCIITTYFRGRTNVCNNLWPVCVEFSLNHGDVCTGNINEDPLLILGEVRKRKCDLFLLLHICTIPIKDLGVASFCGQVWKSQIVSLPYNGDELYVLFFFFFRNVIFS